MNDRTSHIERRLDRRIPLGCPAAIRLKTGETIRGECVEISVGGMTLRAPYVPGQAEVLEVTVAVPGNGSVARPPLVARLEVKRCHALGQGLYEIGGTTVRVVG
ncbi:PilZ domain-containing protein [Aromatoleum toluclasticum]|uniref:PilZ domain-containing protein n=1 Tax=Aromatoleum toluclasticum TaxID=92003 RepID=UPI001D17F461|nr:PilZ domain-containing protein [Aromatoleum toluclasticum]MCC4115511.1 PilZ domain-containing protein [Aromatoleum toluclasticum]